MYFVFGSKSSLLLIFFLHGLVFSGLLFIKAMQGKDKASYWLSCFTILCALYISPFMLGYAGWYFRNPYRDILFYLPLQQVLLLPPVLYFYCKTLFDKSFVFRKKDWLHFVPAILYLLYALVIVITDKLVLGYPYFYADEKDKDFAYWYQLAGFISLLFYLIRSLQLYSTYKYLTYNTVSNADSLTFKWAQRFLLAFLLLLCMRGLFFILNPEWASFGRKFWYYIVFSILFYYISISGYINSIRSITSFMDWSGKTALPEADNSNQQEVVAEQNGQPQPEEKQLLPDIDLWKEKIEALLVTGKMYENPELSIADVSQQLATHTKKISQVINQGFNMNFNDFVNHYRVRAVIKKMEEGEHSLQTLLGIAFECGFNSKSTFNRAFKRHTSLSPNDYIQKNVNKQVSNQDLKR
jgi:AraC-like DNA-binding protein